MNAVALKRPRLVSYLVVCGLSMGLGWGVVGVTTGVEGDVVAGVLGALAIALVSPDDRKRNRAATLGVAGGLGVSIGGVLANAAMPAEWLHSRGPGGTLLLLGVEGALLGGIAGGGLGLALSCVNYKRREVLCLVFIGLGYAMVALLGKAPAHNLICKTVPLILFFFLFWLLVIKRDRAAFFVAVASVVGFGLGAALGPGLVGRPWDPATPLHASRAAAIVMGLCGGLSWGLVAFVLDEDRVRPRMVTWGFPTWAGFTYIMWWAPVTIGDDIIRGWVLASQWPSAVAVWTYRGATVALALVCLAILAGRSLKTASMGMTVLAFLWVGTSCVALEFLTVLSPLLAPHAFSCVHAVLGAFWVVLAVYAVVRWRRGDPG